MSGIFVKKNMFDEKQFDDIRTFFRGGGDGGGGCMFN